MSITTTNSNFDFKVAAAAILNRTVFKTVLADVVQSWSSLYENTGSYKVGSTVTVEVPNSSATSFVNDVSTNNDISFNTASASSVDVTIQDLAINNFSIPNTQLIQSVVDGQLNIDRYLITYADRYAKDIETRQFLNTFNNTDLDTATSKYGATGGATAFTYNDLLKIRTRFEDAGAFGDLVVILPSDQFQELITSREGQRRLKAGANEAGRRYAYAEEFGIKVYSTSLSPTPTQLTNITETGSFKVGFAFPVQSVSMVNPVYGALNLSNATRENISVGGFNATVSYVEVETKNDITHNVIMRSYIGGQVIEADKTMIVFGGEA